MSIYFKTEDTIHRIPVKFVKANLPNANKPFNLRAVHLRELDIRGIAGKAEAYDIPVNSKIIDEGLSAAFELMKYLIADGYIIKTPLFTIRLKFPGEYNGSESGLAEGKFPSITITFTKDFKDYLKEKVEIEVDGMEQTSGFIAEMRDEASGSIDKVTTRGDILTIMGKGLKILSDPGHESEVGVFFVPPAGKAIKAQVIPVNEAKTLKVIAPYGLKSGTAYTVMINTMSGFKCSRALLKEMRSFKSGVPLLVT